MSEINIDELAKQIADRVRPVIPIEYALWTCNHIAEYLCKSPSYVQQRIVCLPDFPKPIKTRALREGKIVEGHPTWKAIEVIRWNEGHRDQPVGRARKAG